MNTERLLALADHLERGKLGHENFDVTVFNKNKDGSPLTRSCGTNGCALGECVYAFPGLWEFTDASDANRVKMVHRPEGDKFTSTFIDACEFFGIGVDEALALFNASGEDQERFGLKRLTYNSTAQDVAENIRLFVEKNK